MTVIRINDTTSLKTRDNSRKEFEFQGVTYVLNPQEDLTVPNEVALAWIAKDNTVTSVSVT